MKAEQMTSDQGKNYGSVNGGTNVNSDWMAGDEAVYPIDSNSTHRQSFKEKKTINQRKAESNHIRTKFPSKVPIIVERYEKEKTLPILDKSKFLVPKEITMSQFSTIIRARMQLGTSQTFYLIANGKSLANMSSTIAEVYENERDDDGFLYMTYASQEMFGACMN